MNQLSIIQRYFDINKVEDIDVSILKGEHEVVVNEVCQILMGDLDSPIDPKIHNYDPNGMCTFFKGLRYHYEDSETDDDETKYHDLAKHYYKMSCEKKNCYAWHYLSYIYEDENNSVLGMKCLLEAISLNFSESMIRMGYVYKHGKLDVEPDKATAEKYYKMAIDAGNDSAHAFLGTLYMNMYNDFELAKEHLLIALDKGYKNDYVYRNLGELYWYLDDNDTAEKYYKMALDINPHDYTALEGLGTIYEDRNDLQTALSYYMKSGENGNNPAYHNVADIYRLKLNDIENAKKYYFLAGEGEYEWSNSWDVLGDIFEEENNTRKAIECYLKSIEIDPESYNAMYSLAKIYEKQDQIDLAIKYDLMAIDSCKHGHEKAMIHVAKLYKAKGGETQVSP